MGDVMKRREVIARGLAVGVLPLIGANAASSQTATPSTSSSSASSSSSSSAPMKNPTGETTQAYEKDEIVTAGSNFLGVTVEALGEAIEKIFADNGDHPVGYIAGQEVSGALGVGLRYGKGNLFMKSQADPVFVYWQGPSVGFDTGGNASRVFTLVYNLKDPELIYRRFPGVEGSAYFIGGLGVNYQRAENIVLAPIRAGLGFRLGANVGYLSYSKKRRFLPL